MTGRSDQHPVMIVLTGAYGNLGDAVIRRRALQWVRPFGVIHAYVGNAPHSWVEQLGLGQDDIVYRSKERASWLRKFFESPRPSVFMLDPGEVPLARRDFMPELVMLGVTVVARLRGSVVIRPPRGIGSISTPTLWVHRISVALSSQAMWRNKKSMKLMKRGMPTPDIAFQEPVVAGAPYDDRRLLIVSMRGKRELPSPAWMESVLGLASSHGLEIHCLSQVREDESRTQELASALGAASTRWGGASDLTQEVAVRELYEHAQIVVSDRLHVLILSALAGAVPVELADSPKGKVDAHFGQIGIHGVSIDTAVSDATAVSERVNALVEGREEIRDRMGSAKLQLDSLQEGIGQLVGPERARTPVAVSSTLSTE